MASTRGGLISVWPCASEESGRKRRQVRHRRATTTGLQKLKVLDLSSTQVTDAGCATLAAALKSGALPALKELFLSGIPARRQRRGPGRRVCVFFFYARTLKTSTNHLPCAVSAGFPPSGAILRRPGSRDPGVTVPGPLAWRRPQLRS